MVVKHGQPGAVRVLLGRRLSATASPSINVHGTPKIQ